MITATASLLVAFIAVGVAVAAWLRPIPDSSASAPPEPTYTEEQVAAAKANVCEAYKIVDQAVVTNTHRANPIDGDEIGSLATGANGRLSIYAGGDYILDRLRAEPATPTDLEKALQLLGHTLKDLGLMFLASQPDSTVQPLKNAVDKHSITIEQLCI